MFTLIEVGRMKRIHDEVMKRFTYVEDSSQYTDKLDWWAPIPPELLKQGEIKGDCDEFARICMLKVMQTELPARLVFCLTEGGEGHLICEVSDAAKEQAYYLDNRQKTIATKAGLRGYRFISVSPWNPTKGDTRPWHPVNLPTA